MLGKGAESSPWFDVASSFWWLCFCFFFPLLHTMLKCSTHTHTHTHTHTNTNHSREANPKVNHGLSQVEQRRIYHPGSVQKNEKQHVCSLRGRASVTHAHTHTHTHTHGHKRSIQNIFPWISCALLVYLLCFSPLSDTHTHMHTHRQMKKVQLSAGIPLSG